jgi:ABC-type multidrug transport system fused ATPase/permease subunit
MMKTLHKLINLGRKEWPLIGLGLFFLALSSGALLLYPHTIKQIIDEALATKNQSQLNRAALLAVLIFALQSIASALRYYFFTLAGEKTVMRLRETLFSQILGQNITFFDRQKTGELLGRLSNDTAVLQNALSVNISMLVRAAVQAIGGIFMLFITSPKLTIFILIVVPPMGLMAARFGRKVKGISKKAQDALAASSGVAEEGIGSIRTVKSFAQEPGEIKRYARRLKHSFELSKEKITEVAKFTNLMSLVGLTAIVFIIWYGGKLVIDGEMTVGTLTSFLLYVMTVAFSVGLLGSLWTDFMSALGASERVFELLEREREDLRSGLTKLSSGKVEFKNVHFAYPSRSDFPVLKGVSFTISPRETVAVVGSSGAGKSTLVQLMMRFYEPDQGDILFEDIRASDYSLKTLRTSLGLVAQEPLLVSESILENIRYAHPEASAEDVVMAAKMAFAHDFISSFPEGYETLVGDRGIQLSGGQKQRVAIARALLKNPQILILDEATSSLDTESEHLVQKALEEQMGKRATLIIAHRLSTVKRADKILVLDQGQIVECGAHEELYKKTEGLYYKLVQKQFNLQKENL